MNVAAGLVVERERCAGRKLPVAAETLTCTDWQNIRTCQDGQGYVSHETQWQGRTYGDDSDRSRWTTTHWNGFDITTTKPPPERR
jgi:hypothetical protein